MPPHEVLSLVTGYPSTGVVMISDWLVPVVSAAGAALAGASATDAWQSARSGVVRLFGRAGQRQAELAQAWAEETATEIAAASAEERPQLVQQWAETWQRRLAGLIEEYPELADELQKWARDLRAQLPSAQQEWVNTFVARDHATQYNAPGGSITVTNHSSSARTGDE
jgi:hypothetical protein